MSTESFYRAKITLVRCEEQEVKYASISNSYDVSSLLRSIWEPDTIELREQFYVIGLDKGNTPVFWSKLSVGGIDGCVVDTRHVFSMAILSNCAAIILAHNHPSGRTQPSQADISMTKKMVEAGKIMNVPVLDHIILTIDSYYSFADEGMI